MIKPVFSYGLQPGSAFILILVVGTVLQLMVICIDYVELSVGRSSTQKYALESGAAQAIAELIVLAEMIVNITCLGYGVIVRGIRPLLITWLVIEGILLFFWEVQLVWWLIETISMPAEPDFEKTGIIIVLLYFIIYTAFYYGYEMNLGVKCLPLFSATSITELEPIGKGFRFIVDYFKSNAKAAASLALMLEIMMNVHVFMDRHLTQYGLGYDYMDDEIDRSTALKIEETFIRYTRVGVCIVGFVLTYKERKLWMFNWCLAYLAVLTISFGIFVYTVFMWRAVHALLTLVYLSSFTINLLFRTGVLYACVRYSDFFERQQGLPL